jgi:hypothetical protein
MKQKSGPEKAPAEQVKDIRVRPAGSTRPKRRSASYWKGCAARRASRSFAAGKASPPLFIVGN